ncbi:MAG: DUF2637 domain-containing protein [Nocardioidaceae bacterium]
MTDDPFNRVHVLPSPALRTGAQPPHHPTTPARPEPRPITTPNEAHTHGDRRTRPLSEGEYTAVAVVTGAVAVLAALGFANSFAAVQAAARASFGGLAFTVPLAVDLGIAVFAALDIVLARLDMRTRWLRMIPWSLVAVTIYLNVAAAHTVFGQVAHGVLPGLWVVAVEAGAHVIRTRAGLASTTRMDAIRRSRWLLAFFSTAALWRRMVLWEIRSYPAALARERDRLLALTELQDAYGRIAWRWRAPRKARALYKLGELTPSRTLPAVADADTSGGPSPVSPGSSSTAATRTGRGRSASRSRTKSKAARRAVPDVEDLMPLGWRIAADLERRGEPLTRDALATGLREADRRVSNARLGALLNRLKTETPRVLGQVSQAAGAEDGGER